MVENVPNSVTILQPNQQDPSLQSMRQNLQQMYSFLSKAINGPTWSVGGLAVPKDASIGTLLTGYVTTTVGANSIYCNAYSASAGMQYLTTGAATAVNLGPGSFALYGAPSGAAGSLVGGAWKNLFSVDSSGNVTAAGGITATGNLTVNGQITSSGASAGLSFWDRAMGGYWQWYSSGNVARLWWNGAGDRFTVDTAGNISAPNSVQCNGVYFQNNSGWFYTPQNFFAGGAVGVGNSTGFYWNYNGGWMWSPNPVLSSSNIQADGSLITNNGYVTFNPLGQSFYPPGDGWLYFNGSLRAYDFQSNNNVNASGSLFCGGLQIYNSSGYLYNANAWRSGNIVQAYSGQCYMLNLGIIYANYCGNQISWLWTGYLYAYIDNGQAGWVTFNGCDARQKSNFGPVGRDALAAINSIELQSFDWPQHIPAKVNRRRGETLEEMDFEQRPLAAPHWEIGYTAQQVREVIPEAVPDPPHEGGFLGVDLQMLVAHLVGAVQQLTRRLEAMEAR